MSNATRPFATSTHKAFFARPSSSALLLMTSALLIVGGCSCGTEPNRAVELTLLTPTADQVLTMADDVDPNVEGLQFDVTGQSVGLREGTPIDLYIDGEDTDVEGEVGEENAITLSAVTLPPGEHTIQLVTDGGAVQSDEERSYVFRALVIDSPDDGDVISDSDSATEGVQARVVVEGFSLEGDGDVALLVDGDEERTLALNAEGRAVFSGVTLAPGSHTLQARSGEIESEEIDVQVSAASCPAVSFVAPVVPNDGDIVLGGPRCPSSGPFTTRVEVAVAASDGTSVDLTLGGTVVATAEVEDDTVVFEDVELSTEGTNQLAVSFEGPAGMPCATQFPAEISVDCESPVCSFRSPVPFVNDGDDTLYLGSAQAGDDGFDIEVQAGDGAVGQAVTLIIDEEEGDARTATAEADGDDAIASFAGVDLADGTHTLSARCRDAIGNVATSNVTFVVDTMACGVDITSPAPDAFILPGDDEDDATDDVDITATTAVVGDDCVGRRVALCDGELPEGDFESFDGTTPFDTSIALAAAGDLELCAEIQDRAGNVGRTSLPFRFRDTAPMLLIENPTDGTNFNALGNGDYERDNDRAEGSLAVCDTEVWVACSELGTDVMLHRGDEEGDVFAMGECEEPDPSDDELPAGFSGRAKIQTTLDDGDEATSFVATQTLAGTSSELLGFSDGVDIGTDCLLPALNVVRSPCTLHGSMQVAFTEAEDLVVEIADESSSPDLAAASLSFTNEAMTGGPFTPSTLTTSSGVFDPIDFTDGLTAGDEGPLTITIDADDNFENRTTYVCASALVNDIPEIVSFEEPADGAEFGPGDQSCGTSVPGEYRLRVRATIDQNADRTVSVLVNGVTVLSDVTLEDTTIDTCVSVPDDVENGTPGPSTVSVQADSDLSLGYELLTHTVSVQTLEILDPVADQLIVSADDCPGGGFDYQVTVAVDEMHEGAAYTLTSGAGEITGTVEGGAIVACVPFDVGGERTLTVSIDGTPIEYSVDVLVVDDTPEITIDEPLDNAAFNVGDATCDAGAGNFGVLVRATLDQADNRQASLLVNGIVVAPDLAIDPDDATISQCVAVPDDLNHTPNGPSTIMLDVDSVLGTGVANASVAVSVDTLDITDPDADDVLLTADDCDTGSGYGYQVDVNVDPAHEGRSLVLNGGAGLVTLTISDDGTETACVPLTVGGDRTIMVSVTGTTITESVSVETVDDSPEIVAITAPADGASFGIDGSQCSAGTGSYGITFSATVDQQANREANILVNGVEVASNVAIGSGGAISTCIALPDNMNHGATGPSELTLELISLVGSASTTASVDANLDTLEIDSPLAGADLVTANDCDPSPSVFGAQLVADVDPSHDGRTYSITGGTGPATGTIAGGAISHCVPVAEGTTVTLTLSIGGTGISESRSFDTFDDEIGTIAITAPADGASFGIDGAQCSAGTGAYGINFTATADQQANREANILVNGVEVASNVAIGSGGAISTCIALPDNMNHGASGPSVIALEVNAVVGAGSETVSVNANLDTLEIDSPLAGADLVAANDCDPSPSVFGAQLVADVDPSHDGRTYSITGGTGSATGTIAGGAISHCVPVALGTEVTLTLSIDSTTISESRSFDTFDDTIGAIAIMAPADGASFGIDGAQCSAGTGAYGITFSAAVDQQANREANILVNGVEVASNVAIGSGGAISTCIALPDNMNHGATGPSEITLEVNALVGGGTASTSVDVNLDTLEIDSPVAGAALTSADDCNSDPGIFGAQLVADVDPSHDGRTYSITGGTGSATGTIAGGAISHCVPVALGTEVTLTLSIGSTTISESRSFDTFDDTIGAIAITAPADGASFGIDGAQCSAGADSYGITFTATADQQANREANILVNGVEVASNVAIGSGGAISTCIALPDNMNHGATGPSEITLEVNAVVGTGTASVSVDANLDTLEIDSPLAGADLVAADDCDPSPSVFGALLVADVDPSHDGRTYSITGGTGSVGGTISGGAISQCVPVAEGASVTLTLSIGGTGISESRSFDTFDDTIGTIAITAPADGASFGIDGAQCSAGTGAYGINFTATADQQANREANILVNGVEVASNVAIGSGGAISTCIALPDNMNHGASGPSEITLEVNTVVGTGTASVSVDANLDTLEIDSPLAGADLVAADDCDPSPSVFGAQLVADVDPSHDGRTYSITGGTGSATGTIAGGAISHCVPVALGTEVTLTLSIGSTTISESRSFDTFDDTIGTIAITAPTSGSSFGVGEQQCDAGSGNYGITFTATLDQQANRRADILVNGVAVATSVTIGSGGTISTCIPVPDNFDGPNGPSTVTLDVFAVVGSGADSDSVTVNVDTLELVSPTDGQTITDADDCDGDAGIDYLVEFNADAALDGAGYTITGGSSTLTGTITQEAMSRCVPFDAGAHTVTVSIDDTAIEESVDVTVEVDAPAIVTFTAPTDNQAFGIGGESCDAASGYGVRVQATIDQSANREVDILVNDVLVVDNAAIVGVAIDQCVSVPDDRAHTPQGGSTIELIVSEVGGANPDTQTRTVNLDLLSITAPTANLEIGVGDTCDAGGSDGVQVTVSVDPSLNGSSYSIDAESTAETGTVSGGAISECVAIADGTRDVTVTVATTITESVSVVKFAGAPTDGIIIDALAAPDLLSLTHRTGVTAAWAQPVEDIPGQLTRYEMRCASTALLGSAIEADKQAWWDVTATAVTLPGALTPDDANPSAPFAFRPEEPQHCLVRAFDGADQGTPITQSTDITLHLRRIALSDGAPNTQLGFDVEPIGDIDSDGFDDLIASGFGYAALYYGSDAGFSSAPDVEFTTVAQFVYLAVAGIGDFNGDGFADFAIADADWVDPDTFATPGRTSVFFGRVGRTLPATLDLSAGCEADLCLNHDEADAVMGTAVAAAGDFNDDGFDDLAIGNEWYQSFATDGQLMVVTGGTYASRACGDEADCRSNESCGGSSTCVLDDPDARWNLEITLPSSTYGGNAPPAGTENELNGVYLSFTVGSAASFSVPVVGLGDIDQDGFDDLAISARELAQVHFLGGRTVGAGFTELTTADLGVTSGQPITASSEFTPVQPLYGYALGALGDFYDPPGGGDQAINDLGVAGALQNRPRVVPGDDAFTSPEVGLLDSTASNLGQSIASGYHAGFGLLGDLDNDDVPELCIGSRGDDATLWYADTFAAAAADTQPVNISTGISVPVPASADTIVQYVGDINGDGYLDIAVGDPGFFDGVNPAPDGQVYLLY